jgi:hypothetical protein
VGRVIGELLPLAIGVAISPLPIIAAIVMLLTRRAGLTSLGLLVGWVVGIVVATVVFVFVASTVGLDESSGPSTAGSWVKIGLGVLLLLAARQWRGRPRPGQPVTMPKWMSAIDSFTLGKAAGLGFVLSAVNPKNLVICATAGATIGAAALSGGQNAVAVAVFTVIGASTVAAPVVGYALAKERMRRPLDELRHWLEAHNNAVMSLLLLVIGVTVIGKGIGGL